MTTQLDCSIGLKEEAAYGTPVVVDQFVEFTNESLDFKPGFLQGKGQRPGYRVARAGRRSIGKIEAGGGITLEAPIKGLGIFLKAALGSVTNTAVVGQAGVFQQVHTPTVTDPLPSYTIQKGIPPQGGGATHAITFPGSMCSSLEINAKAGEIVEIVTDWTSREAKTDIGYAPPSYPAALDLFTFVHGQIVIAANGFTAPTATALAAGGTAVANITEFSTKWDNGLDSDGWNLGGAGKRSRKAWAGEGKLTGKLGAEYDSTTLRDAYLAQTDLGVLLTFTHTSVIGTSANPVLQVYIPCINLGGSIPAAANGGVIKQSIDFTGLDPQVTAQAPLYVVYRSTDAAP